MEPERDPDTRVRAELDRRIPAEPGAVFLVAVLPWVSTALAPTLPDGLHLLVLDPLDFARAPGDLHAYVAPVLVGEPLPRGPRLAPLAVAGGNGVVAVGLCGSIHTKWLERGRLVTVLDAAAFESVRGAVREERVRMLLAGRAAEEGSLVSALANAMTVIQRRVPVAGASKVVIAVDVAAPQPLEPELHQSDDGILAANAQVGHVAGGRTALHISAFHRGELVEGLRVAWSVRSSGPLGCPLGESEATIPPSGWAFWAVELPPGAPASLAVEVGPVFLDDNAGGDPDGVRTRR